MGKDSIANYRIVRPLGKGSYGVCYLVRHRKKKQHFVLKKVKVPSSGHFKKVVTEVEVLMKCARGHPNICRYRSSFVSADGCLNIVLDYCSHGDLAQFIDERKRTRRPLNEREVLHLFVQLAHGVKHVHDRHVLHRDIKTQNVFLSPPSSSAGNIDAMPIVKLGDFGIAKMLGDGDEFAATRIGTPFYMSPEVCRGERYNHKSDIWALGCILHELCCLKHGFDGRSVNLLALNICRGQVSELPLRFSRELRALHRALLSQDPALRPDITQVLDTPVLRAAMRDFVASPPQREPMAAGAAAAADAGADENENDQQRKGGKLRKKRGAAKKGESRRRRVAPASVQGASPVRVSMRRVMADPDASRRAAKEFVKRNKAAYDLLASKEDDENVVKFVFRDKTLRLPSDRGVRPLSYRIEALRAFLETHVGVPTLLRCYALLRSLSRDDSDEHDRVAARIRSMFPGPKLDYVALIQQLLVCEEYAFEN